MSVSAADYARLARHFGLPNSKRAVQNFMMDRVRRTLTDPANVDVLSISYDVDPEDLPEALARDELNRIRRDERRAERRGRIDPEGFRIPDAPLPRGRRRTGSRQVPDAPRPRKQRESAMDISQPISEDPYESRAPSWQRSPLPGVPMDISMTPGLASRTFPDPQPAPRAQAVGARQRPPRPVRSLRPSRASPRGSLDLPIASPAAPPPASPATSPPWFELELEDEDESAASDPEPVEFAQTESLKTIVVALEETENEQRHWFALLVNERPPIVRVLKTRDTGLAELAREIAMGKADVPDEPLLLQVEPASLNAPDDAFTLTPRGSPRTITLESDGYWGARNLRFEQYDPARVYVDTVWPEDVGIVMRALYPDKRIARRHAL